MLIQRVLKSLSELERKEALIFFYSFFTALHILALNHTHTISPPHPCLGYFKILIMSLFRLNFSNVTHYVKKIKAKFLFLLVDSLKNKEIMIFCIILWLCLFALFYVLKNFPFPYTPN